MIVCSCHVVTDKQIRRAAREGARCPREVARACRAGTRCGGCRDTVEEILLEVHGSAQAGGEVSSFAPADAATSPA